MCGSKRFSCLCLRHIIVTGLVAVYASPISCTYKSFLALYLKFLNLTWRRHVIMQSVPDFGQEFIDITLYIVTCDKTLYKSTVNAQSKPGIRQAFQEVLLK